MSAGAPPLGLWRLAWPSMTMFFLQSLVHLVDFVIVGSLGTEAVAAVGVAAQFFNILFAVLAAVTTGTVALIARAMGAGEREEAERLLRASIGLGAAFALAVSCLIPLADRIVAALGVDAAVVRIGASYLRIQLSFTLPFAVGFVIASALRGAGDVRTPLAIGVVMNVVNVVASYGLVYGELGLPRLGTDGSAIASGIAFTTSAALSLGLWRRGTLVLGARAPADGLALARARRLLRIGLPTAMEQLAWQAGLWLFLRLVSLHGTEPVSAYLIGVRILAFSFVPGLGFSAAAATLVGQHLGAGQPELAARSGWRANWLAMLVMAIAGSAIVAAAPTIASHFGAAGPRTVALTVTFIWILGAAQPLMAVEYALGGALRGAGDTRFPLVSILSGLFVFRLGGALFVTYVLHAGVVAVWSCLLADYLVKAALLAARFRSGRWQHARV